jgi:hypothetical protein
LGFLFVLFFCLGESIFVFADLRWVNPKLDAFFVVMCSSVGAQFIAPNIEPATTSPGQQTQNHFNGKKALFMGCFHKP